MSWESTVFYYQQINREINYRLGGLHSAQMIMNSVDFAPIERHQHAGEWDATADILCSAAQSLERAGADFFLICTNTMHKVADRVAASVKIPLLHIAEATCAELQSAGINKVGLLGTAFVMEQRFYIDRLQQAGIEVAVPPENERKIVHEVIYHQLCHGIVNDESRQQYLQIIRGLAKAGAQAVILGCTEIGMLVKQADTSIQLFDTTLIHARQAVRQAID